MSLFDELKQQVNTRPARLTWSTFGRDHIVHRDQERGPDEGSWYVHFPEGRQLGRVWMLFGTDCHLEYDHERRAAQVEKTQRQISDGRGGPPSLGLHAWVRVSGDLSSVYDEELAEVWPEPTGTASTTKEIRYTPVGFVVPDRPGTVEYADAIVFCEDGSMFGRGVR